MNIVNMRVSVKFLSEMHIAIVSVSFAMINGAILAQIVT